MVFVDDDDVDVDVDVLTHHIGHISERHIQKKKRKISKAHKNQAKNHPHSPYVSTKKLCMAVCMVATKVNGAPRNALVVRRCCFELL